MDLNDYLSSLNDDLQKEIELMNKIQADRLDTLFNSVNQMDSPSPSMPLSATGSVSDSCSSIEPATISRLLLDERLEESSKSKLGTFERIYEDTFLEDTQRPISSYGFNDLDYSPLVITLATVLEIELNHSLYQKIRKDHGVDIDKFFYRDTEGEKIYFDSDKKFVVDLGKSKQMLRGLYMIIKHDRSSLLSYIRDFDRFTYLFNRVIDKRNDVSHEKAFSKEEFLNFYSNYSELYNEYIPGILDVKDMIKPLPKSSYNYSSFLESYAYDFDAEQSDDDYIRSILNGIGSQIKRGCSCGIIMTDCNKLSVKYYGNSRWKNEIYNDFQQIIEEYCKLGIEYVLFDIDDKYYSLLEDNPGWMGYHKALDEYCRENNITAENPKGLFIVGGDDVIPMPRVDNPSSEKFELCAMNLTVDADLLYAYDGSAVRVYQGNKLSWDALFDKFNKPRFYVGRLPLENGMMTTSFEDDICGYFSRALSAYHEGGIDVKAPTLTACYSAKRCGQKMVENIPLLPLNEMANCFEDNMIVSPMAMLDTEHNRKSLDKPIIRNLVDNPIEVVSSRSREFLDVFTRADMAIFLLHGGYAPARPMYSGEMREFVPNEGWDHVYADAFSPQIFAQDEVKIKSVAGVCCYGARFIDYARNDSALLTAIHNDTLLFFGSSRTAYGSFDTSLEYSGGQIEYALVQMKYYLKNLLSGVQAGVAIHNAKLEYARHRINARRKGKEYEDVLEYFYTTLLEFNLFGDPLLNVQKMIDVQPELEEDSGPLPNFIYDARSERIYTTIYSAEKVSRLSILDRVRRLTDQNFENIHQKIADLLYSLHGINTRELYCAKRFTDGYGNAGYSLLYKSGTESFDTYKIVDVDENGNIISMVETI